MKNKEKYDLTKIITQKTEEQGRKVIKIYDCSDEENKILIDTVDRGAGVPRNQIFAKWAEKEYKEPEKPKLKFKVGDYAINNFNEVVKITEVDNRAMMYLAENKMGRLFYYESELRLSPLNEAEHDFLQYMVDHIKPKIERFKKCITVNHGEKYLAFNGGRFPTFSDSEMYEGMELGITYTLAELGLEKEKKND
jgi:hypothetical protein